MKGTYNNLKLKNIRRTLRKNQTSQERLLWSKIRNRQLCGLRFLRQFSVGSYVLDFYCPSKRLAVELDGGHHGETEQSEHDALRTRFLESRNIRVIRFWNPEIVTDLQSVLNTILREVGINPFGESNSPSPS